MGVLDDRFTLPPWAGRLCLIEKVKRLRSGTWQNSHFLNWNGICLRRRIFYSSKPAAPELASLPQREQQVLRLLAEGATNKQIAERLFISEETVKTHIAHLFERLNCKNRAQVAIVANSIFNSEEH